MQTDREVVDKFWEEDRKFKELYAELPEEKKGPADYLYQEGVAVDDIRKDMEGDVSWYYE